MDRHLDSNKNYHHIPGNTDGMKIIGSLIITTHITQNPQGNTEGEKSTLINMTPGNTERRLIFPGNTDGNNHQIKRLHTII